MTKKSVAQPSLEESLGEITGLIDNMEHGELTLEQSLHHFERGITLIKHCQKILSDAEQKVEVLIKQNQEERLVPFDDASSEDDDHADKE